MDSIRQLQKLLAQGQDSLNGKTISEKNCVDLVQKLVELDNVKLVQTTTGKEWLTPEQLDREIRDCLTSSGGRLSVFDLPVELGIAIEHIESRVELMCKKDGSLTRLQGELLSDQFLQGVAKEVEESLAELGCLTGADLAVRHNLPADFVRSSVLNRIKIPNTNKQNQIYTHAYAARVGARARGALRGCTSPVTLAQVAARHRLDPDVLATAVQNMLKDGTLLGKLQGSTFTPKVSADAKAGKIDSFYSTNQYLPLALAKSAGVTVKDWAKEKGVEGVTLSTAFVDEQLIDPVVASITDAVGRGHFVDVVPLLPASLVVADARELLVHLKKKLPAELMKDAAVLDHVVMSKKFIKSLSSKFAAETKTIAERLLSAPAGKAPTKKPAPADDDDDDGGGKKKGKRGAKAKKGRGDDDDDDAGGGGNTGGGESGVDSQKLVALLSDDFPDLPEDVHEHVCGLVQPLLAAMVKEAQNALASTLQNKRKEQFEGSEKFVQEYYEKVVFGLKALDAKKDLASSPLQQHFLREAVAEPLHRLLGLRLHELNGTETEVTSANRRQILDQIIAKQGAAKADSLSRLFAAATGKKDAKDKAPAKAEKAPKDEKKKKGKKGKGDSESEDEPAEKAPQTIDAIYHAAASDCHIFCKKVDQKREKTFLSEATANCRDKLAETTKAEKAVDALQEVRQKDPQDRQVYATALNLAILLDGVAGLLFPADDWALKLVAKSLGDDAVREEALQLCSAAEKIGTEGDGTPKATGVEQPNSSSPLRADLGKLAAGALRKQAVALGIASDEIDEADDADDAKAAFIELILAKQAKQPRTSDTEEF